MKFSEDSANWIFAHRGLWESEGDKNSVKAIVNAFAESFGVETDFRDCRGMLVVSHDVEVQSDPFVFDLFCPQNRFAINLKSDGLQKFFVPYLDILRDSGSFVFDGSVPEILKYRNLGIPLALRLSEYENSIPWNSEYVWVDGFYSDWWQDNKYILELVERSHLVFVSPELHGREHREAFEWFVRLRKDGYNNFSVCTDYPLELIAACNE